MVSHVIKDSDMARIFTLLLLLSRLHGPTVAREEGVS